MISLNAIALKRGPRQFLSKQRKSARVMRRRLRLAELTLFGKFGAHK